MPRTRNEICDREVLMTCLGAIEAAIPCLTDWCKTTGYGEVHGRDVLALRGLLRSLDEHRALVATCGVQSEGANAWPEAIRVSGYKSPEK